MSMQVVDTEVVQSKLQPFVDTVQDGTISKVVPAVEGVVDIAKEVGSSKLEQSAGVALEAAAAFTKQMNELAELMQSYVDNVKRMDAALN